MKRSVLAASVATLFVGITALATSRPAVGDVGCLSDDYLGGGGARTIETVYESLPDTVGLELAKEVALEKAAVLPDRATVIGTKLVLLDDRALGHILVYLVGTPVDGPQQIIGTNVTGTAPCEVSIIDAMTGRWLFSYVMVTPDAGASFAEFPKLEP